MNKLVGHDENDPKDQIIADVAADLLAVIRKHAKTLNDETERSMTAAEIHHGQSIVDTINRVPGMKSANMSVLALRAGMLTTACLGIAIRSFMQNDLKITPYAVTAALESFECMVSGSSSVLQPDSFSAASNGGLN